MDKVAEEVDRLKNDWNDAFHHTLDRIKAIEAYQNQTGSMEKNSLPRLNALAQDGLNLLSSLEFKLDLLAPQLLSDSEVEAAQSLLESWKNQSYNLRSSLRNANMQAKANMRKAAQEEDVGGFHCRENDF